MVKRLPVKESVVGSTPTSGAESWCGIYMSRSPVKRLVVDSARTDSARTVLAESSRISQKSSLAKDGLMLQK